MSLPFNTDQFLDIFAKYNVTVWPAQLAIYLLGVSCVVLALFRGIWSSSIISLILSAFWLWMGVAYHFLFFSFISKVAPERVGKHFDSHASGNEPRTTSRKNRSQRVNVDKKEARAEG